MNLTNVPKSLLVASIALVFTFAVMIPEAEARFEQGDILIDAQSSALFQMEDEDFDELSDEDSETDRYGLDVRARYLHTPNIYYGGGLGFSDEEMEADGGEYEELTFITLSGGAGYLFTPELQNSFYAEANVGFVSLDFEEYEINDHQDVDDVIIEADDLALTYGVSAGYIAHFTERFYADIAISYMEREDVELTVESPPGTTHEEDEFDSETTSLDVSLGYRF